MGDAAKIITDVAEWERMLARLGSAHILQTWQWGEHKQRFGWAMQPYSIISEGGGARAAAMVLKRSLQFGRIHLPLNLLYCPRGPVLNWDDIPLQEAALVSLENLAKVQRTISLKIDPEVISGAGLPGPEEDTENLAGKAYVELLTTRGWRYSPSQVQFRNTVWLDLEGAPDDWLGRMKQKTRYNVRLAGRKGVIIRTGSLEDIPLVYRMYVETSLRDGFVIRSQAYYTSLWENFMRAGLADILIAEVEGEPVSALVLFHHGTKAWYFYGMSTGRHNDKMPNYLIQWEAMQKAKGYGCKIYDLWGAPDNFDQSDRLWGVYRFKEGFGGTVIRTPGAWDYAPYPTLYSLFTVILPRLLNVMRRRRMQQEKYEAL